MTTSSIKYLSSEKRRAVIVDTVISLAGEHNPSQITTAAIAKRMGLTQGALFRHFPSKEAIFQAVMEWVTDRLMARIEKAIRGKSSPLSALEGMFMAHVDFIIEHPGIPRMLFGELQHAEASAPKRMAQTLMRHYKERLYQLIEKGKLCGEIESQINTDAASTLFIGIIQGLVMQSMLIGDVGRIRHDAPIVFSIFERGIRSEQ